MKSKGAFVYNTKKHLSDSHTHTIFRSMEGCKKRQKVEHSRPAYPGEVRIEYEHKGLNSRQNELVKFIEVFHRNEMLAKRLKKFYIDGSGSDEAIFRLLKMWRGGDQADSVTRMLPAAPKPRRFGQKMPDFTKKPPLIVLPGCEASAKAFLDKNPQLAQLWENLKEGRHNLVSGPAGTGKSVLLRRLRAFCQRFTPHRVAVLAPTGVAAMNVDGQTYHSWLSMGDGKAYPEVIWRKLCKRKINGQFTPKSKHLFPPVMHCDIIIFDEISMVRSDMFDMIGWLVYKTCTRREGIPNSSPIQPEMVPFGDRRVVMFGDNLQLPPVYTNDDRLYRKNHNMEPLENKLFAFQSNTWKLMNVKRLRLSMIYRQNDQVFTAMLNRIRLGQLSDEDAGLLSMRKIGPGRATLPHDEKKIVRLFPRNKDVCQMNLFFLNRIQGAEVYLPIDKCQVSPNDEMAVTEEEMREAKRISMDLNGLGKYFQVTDIHLKNGSRVMMRVNDAGLELCNGSMGTVVDVDALTEPVTEDTSGTMVPKTGSVERAVKVRFDNGKVHTIGPYEMKRNLGSVTLTIRQIPLSLAWAMSIHKCQGLTLDRAIVDGRCFAEGQFYVSMSRVKSLEGLWFTDYKASSIRANQFALQFESS